MNHGQTVRLDDSASVSLRMIVFPSPLEGEGGRFGRMRGSSRRSNSCATTCPQVVCLIEHDLRTSRGTGKWESCCRQDIPLNPSPLPPGERGVKPKPATTPTRQTRRKLAWPLRGESVG